MKSLLMIGLSLGAILLLVCVALMTTGTLGAQAIDLTRPQIVHSRDFFEVVEAGGKLRIVELYTDGGLGRQVHLYQHPASGAGCNAGKFGTFGDYLYVCRAVDFTTHGQWSRMKLETGW